MNKYLVNSGVATGTDLRCCTSCPGYAIHSHSAEKLSCDSGIAWQPDGLLGNQITTGSFKALHPKLAYYREVVQKKHAQGEN